MFCRKCGKELSQGARFCTYCGTQVSGLQANRNPSYSANIDTQAKQTANNQSKYDIAQANSLAERLVPRKLRVLLPGVPALGFIAAYVVMFVLSVVLVSSVVGGSHDLSGTYLDASAPRFPVTRITFSTDGTFVAYCDYYEYNTGSPRYGTYSKSGNRYRLKYDSGLVGYDLSVEKQSNGSLKLSIIPVTTGFAWSGDFIYIYPRQ